MSDNERPRDRHHDRPGRRDPRDDRNGDRSRGGTPNERRNRSRSPRERGPYREPARHRSRSPYRRDDRDDGGRGGRGRGGRGRGGRGRGGGDRGPGREDRGRNYHDRDDDRAPPTGPRGAPYARAPTGPRASTDSAKKEEAPDVVMKEPMQRPEGMDDETWEMHQVMGFNGFKSTKNTKVPGNQNNFGVRRDKQMEARQYMNRQGGFNRPLSPSRG
jgi:U4/U6.U5 tri-snRNP-associated protein 3